MSVDTLEPAAAAAPASAADIEERRWKYLNHIRRNPGPYTDPDATGPEFLEQFDKFKVLVMSVYNPPELRSVLVLTTTAALVA
ncbi:NEDD8 activating enzyme [Fusarium falciforme]